MYLYMLPMLIRALLGTGRRSVSPPGPGSRMAAVTSRAYGQATALV